MDDAVSSKQICSIHYKSISHLSEKPVEESIVLFRKPQANSKNDPVELSRILKISKEPNSSIEEYTVDYHTNTLGK